MHNLEKFYTKIIKYELINKFSYTSTKKLPKFQKIILSFSCKTINIKKLSSGLLAFELITSQQGKLTSTKYSNILFKIRKGNPTGCKLALYNFQLFKFFSIMITEVFPKFKNFKGLNQKISEKVFSYKLTEIFNFPELENHYYLFNNLAILNITIITNSKTKEETMFLLKAFKLPFLLIV